MFAKITLKLSFDFICISHLLDFSILYCSYKIAFSHVMNWDFGRKRSKCLTRKKLYTTGTLLWPRSSWDLHQVSAHHGFCLVLELLDPLCRGLVQTLVRLDRELCRRGRNTFGRRKFRIFVQEVLRAVPRSGQKFSARPEQRFGRRRRFVDGLKFARSEDRWGCHRTLEDILN